MHVISQIGFDGDKVRSLQFAGIKMEVQSFSALEVHGDGW